MFLQNDMHDSMENGRLSWNGLRTARRAKTGMRRCSTTGGCPTASLSYDRARDARPGRAWCRLPHVRSGHALARSVRRTDRTRPRCSRDWRKSPTSACCRESGLDAMHVSATFFVIVKTCAAPPGIRAGDRGAGGMRWPITRSVISKTFSQPSRPEMEKELRECDETLAAIVGVPPRGFRAPGYTINAQVLALLQAMHYQYDASLVPSWSHSGMKIALKMCVPHGAPRPESGLFRAPGIVLRAGSQAALRAAPAASVRAKRGEDPLEILDQRDAAVAAAVPSMASSSGLGPE